MLRKFVLPLVAAAAIVGGVSVTSASASPVIGVYTTAHYTGNHHNHRPRLHKVCQPVTKWIKVWTRHGWDWKRVVIGQKCHWVRW